VINLCREDARRTLADIAVGEVGLSILPWLPLTVLPGPGDMLDTVEHISRPR